MKILSDLYIIKLSGEYIQTLYKIGTSCDVKQREQAITTDIPFANVTLMRIFPACGQLEKQIHSRIKRYNAGGEYFKSNDRLDNLIDGEITIIEFIECSDAEEKELLKWDKELLRKTMLLPATNNKERAIKIKAIMHDKKMTASDLSVESGIHCNTISNALNGKGITVTTLIGIANGLGVSETTLV